jgi:hypothetical protein
MYKKNKQLSDIIFPFSTKQDNGIPVLLGQCVSTTTIDNTVQIKDQTINKLQNSKEILSWASIVKAPIKKEFTNKLPDPIKSKPLVYDVNPTTNKRIKILGKDSNEFSIKELFELPTQLRSETGDCAPYTNIIQSKSESKNEIDLTHHSASVDRRENDLRSTQVEGDTLFFDDKKSRDFRVELFGSETFRNERDASLRKNLPNGEEVPYEIS